LPAFSNAIIGMAYYWPIISGSLNEYIASQNLVAVGSPSFVNSRSGTTNGAIKRTAVTSYWQAPAGVYFSGDFTITGWIYITSATKATFRKFPFIFFLNNF
jgi:hypothetical protein